MSGGSHETVSVSDGEIAVQKVVDTTKFEVPAVVYHIESNAVETKRIRIRQPFPETVSQEDIGFHPEYGAEWWTTERSEAVFAREIDPGDSVITLFGVLGVDPETDDWLMSKPNLDIIESISDTPKWMEVFESDQPEKTGANPFTRAEQSENRRSPPSGEDSIISRLAEALDNDDYSEDDLRSIESHLAHSSGATETRIGHLQNQISDLTAYIDALEDFFDDHGTAAVLDRIVEDVSTLDTRLTKVEESTDVTEDTITELRSEMDQMGDRLSSIDEEISAIKKTAAQQNEQVNRNTTDIRSATESIEELKSELTTIRELRVAHENQAERIESLEETLHRLETNLQTVRTFHNRLTTTLEESA